ncbi:hypothetical protein LIA77_03413 [Sarocladium implicatum]|nr:hypothetical protein LIA77_03413 [Sarocladium implicatum]
MRENPTNLLFYILPLTTACSLERLLRTLQARRWCPASRHRPTPCVDTIPIYSRSICALGMQTPESLAITEGSAAGCQRWKPGHGQLTLQGSVSCSASYLWCATERDLPSSHSTLYTMQITIYFDTDPLLAY